MIVGASFSFFVHSLVSTFFYPLEFLLSNPFMVVRWWELGALASRSPLKMLIVSLSIYYDAKGILVAYSFPFGAENDLQTKNHIKIP